MGAQHNIENNACSLPVEPALPFTYSHPITTAAAASAKHGRYNGAFESWETTASKDHLF